MSRSKIDPKKFVQSGKHLPKVLRDFHDAKDVFKAIHRAYGHELAENAYIRDVTWTSAQVYTIDWFLWFMGQRGYTLQRSRASVDFLEVEDDIKRMKDENAEAFRKVWDSIRPGADPALESESTNKEQHEIRD